MPSGDAAGVTAGPEVGPGSAELTSDTGPGRPARSEAKDSGPGPATGTAPGDPRGLTRPADGAVPGDNEPGVGQPPDAHGATAPARMAIRLTIRRRRCRMGRV